MTGLSLAPRERSSQGGAVSRHVEARSQPLHSNYRQLPRDRMLIPLRRRSEFGTVRAACYSFPSTGFRELTLLLVLTDTAPSTREATTAP